MQEQEKRNLQNRLTKLAKIREFIEERMGEIAWELTPIDIRSMLHGQFGVFGTDNLKRVQRWLIESRWEFSGKSPVELILENREEEVKKFIVCLSGDSYL